MAWPPSPRPYVAPPEDGASQELQDLRHVYLNGKDHDATMGHEIARGLLKKSPREFLSLKAQVEREHKSTSRGHNWKLEDETKRDLGTERALALCEKLLNNFHKEEAKQNAELARRPDAAEFAATFQRSLASALDREKRLQDRVKELERYGSAKTGG